MSRPVLDEREIRAALKRQSDKAGPHPMGRHHDSNSFRIISLTWIAGVRCMLFALCAYVFVAENIGEIEVLKCLLPPLFYLTKRPNYQNFRDPFSRV